jgi:hypothetical protein
MAHPDWYADTDPRALEALIRLQREMPPARKAEAAIEMSVMLMRLAEDDVRRLDPGLDDREVFLRAAARRLDRDTMIRVYGWDPEGQTP